MSQTVNGTVVCVHGTTEWFQGGFKGIAYLIFIVRGSKCCHVAASASFVVVASSRARSRPSNLVRPKCFDSVVKSGLSGRGGTKNVNTAQCYQTVSKMTDFFC